MTDKLIVLLSELKEEEALELVKERLASGEDPLKILEDARAGMEIVGQRFADGEYFIPDLVYSGEILSQIAEIAKGKVDKDAPSKALAKCIIGTVAGDIHDIGKNIVTFMLDVNGFEVYDIGVDVPAQKFIEKVKETNAEILALSGFLTSTFEEMKNTVDAIAAAGLRSTVKIMIGGGQIDERVRVYSGADAYGTDAMTAVQLAKGWVGVG